MPTYLVTGGCGFIGSNIAEHLVKAGETVRILDNLSTGKTDNLAAFRDGLTVIEGSITEPATVRKAVEGVDFILHQAALPSVPRSVEDPISSNEHNVDGTLLLLNEARQAGVKRVVFAASSSAYGDQPVEVKTEDLLPMPKSPYAVAKLTGEYYLKSFFECYGLETVALRYFNVFGPRQDPSSHYSAVIPKFVAAVLKNESPIINGDGTQSRDFTYVENNVRANVLACTAPKAPGHVMNVACGTSFTLIELLDRINEILGKNVKPVFGPARAGDVMHSLASIERAKELLGYEVTVSFEEGLRRTVEWYKTALQG